jgi:hypothetical protein
VGPRLGVNPALQLLLDAVVTHGGGAASRPQATSSSVTSSTKPVSTAFRALPVTFPAFWK